MMAHGVVIERHEGTPQYLQASGHAGHTRSRFSRGGLHAIFGRKTRRRLQTLRRRARLYIEGMNVAFDLPPAQAEKLQREAERLGVSPSDLARAALSDLLADRDEDFRAATERALRKNAELYRRLA